MARKTVRHPVNIMIQGHFGDRAADWITNFSGTWLFLIFHIIWWLIWHFLDLDINLLTLWVSLEAIILSTFVLMSQSRSSQRDHLLLEHDAEQADVNYQLLKGMKELLDINTELTKENKETSEAMHNLLKEGRQWFSQYFSPERHP